MKALTPSQTYTFIANALAIRKIPYVAGQPGIGKSDVNVQVAEDFNLKLIDERLSQKLPEDLTGLPSLNEKTGKAQYNPFDTFPMESDIDIDPDTGIDRCIPKGYSGWLIFLDELSSAPDEVWAAIYSLLLGHSVGGKKLHPKALIVAAGNRATDSAIARPLPDTLITRMLVCEMKVSSKDWIKWAEKPSSKSHESVIGFIKKYPDMICGEANPKIPRGELETYNTPRGWGTMSSILYLHEKNAKKIKITRKDKSGVPAGGESAGSIITPDIKCLMSAAVGVMASQAFIEHYNEAMQIPFPWDIAQAPSSTPVPTSSIGKAKVTADLAEHFIDTQDQSRDAILQYMNRMDKEHSAVFVEMIKEKIGITASDVAMISNIRKRLNVDLIDVEGAVPDDEDAPFRNYTTNTIQSTLFYD